MCTSHNMDAKENEQEKVCYSRKVKSLSGRTPDGEMYNRLAEGIAVYLKATTASVASITGKSYRDPVWEEIASSVGDHPALKHRKRLHMIWKQNRGNIQTLVSSLIDNQSSEQKGDHVTTDSNNVTTNLGTPSKRDEQAKKTVIESDDSNTNFETAAAPRVEKAKKAVIDSENATLNLQTPLIRKERSKKAVTESDNESTNLHTPSTRKERAKKVTPAGFVKTDSVIGRQKGKSARERNLCGVCHSYSQSESGTDLWICCDICGKWYHCHCIGVEGKALQMAASRKLAKKVKFHCGMKMCQSENATFQYKRKRKTIRLSINVLKAKNLKRLQHEDVIKIESDPLEESTAGCNMSEPQALEELQQQEAFQEVQHDQLAGSIGRQPNEVTLNEEDTVEERPTLENIDNADEIDMNGDVRESLQRNVPMNHDTVAKLSHCDLPEEWFEASVDEESYFEITREEWANLYRTTSLGPNYRRFGNRDWTHFFNNIIEQYNPYCTVMFKRHQLCKPSQNEEKVLFRAYGHCKHDECGVKDIRIVLYANLLGSISFDSSKVRHRVENLYARPISGKVRERLREKLASGHKPYKERIQRMANISKDAMSSGNRNTVGKDSHIFRQIAYEGRIKGRRHKNELEGLRLFAAELSGLTNSNEVEDTGRANHNKDEQHMHPAKIQFSLIPLTVMYWNEASVRLFHDLADHDIISWDATGKIVRSSLTKRKLFYYEITARHPKKGMISVPLSVMISDTHTLPILQNWLTAFRHHEKEIFGSNNLSNPVQFDLI